MPVMRFVLFILILSVFVSGYTVTANAFQHAGAKDGHALVIDCCPEKISIADLDSHGKDTESALNDIDCHHGCSAQTALPYFDLPAVDSVSSMHELRPAYLVKSEAPSSLFRPPQFSA